jgi:membrane associated rhomboid family serine protease
VFPLRDNVPSNRFPFVNYFLIALNGFVFFKELQLAHAGLLEQFIFQHGLVPARFLAEPVGQSFTLLSAMFMHGGWAHLLGNMWFLFVFGDNVEDNMGPVKYLIYYLLVGIGAAALQIYMHPESQLPMVGASGAIAGVLGGYFILYPRAKVLTFFVFVVFIRLVEIPAFFYLLLWFFTQTMNGLGSLSKVATRADTGGVAWWAHAGGFISGFVLVNFFRKFRGKYG